MTSANWPMTSALRKRFEPLPLVVPREPDFNVSLRFTRKAYHTGAMPKRKMVEKETPIEERNYLSLYGLSIGDCRGLTSLAGLEALEELDALSLASNPDLVSLAGLSSVLELPELRLSAAAVDLRGAPPVRKLSISRSAWTDLSPLGDARALESLALADNSALATLAGAQLPERLEALSLSNNPALENLDGLEALSAVEWLSIATVSPQPKRDFRRSSRPVTSLG